MNIVYILKCSDGTLYTGYTNDIKKRIHEHNCHGTKGAKYTKGRRPVSLLYTEAHASKSDALKREIEIKKYTRAKKLNLVKDSHS